MIQQPASVPAIFPNPVDLPELEHDERGSTYDHMIQEREINSPLNTVDSIQAGGTPSVSIDAEMPVCDEAANSTRDIPEKYSHYESTIFSSSSF